MPSSDHEVPPRGFEFGTRRTGRGAGPIPRLKTRHPHDSIRTRGKVVLITGRTGGLGSATARALLSRGARGGIVDLRPDTPEIAARISSSNVVGFTADVCDRNALADAVAHLPERFGRVDIVIANAGIMGQGSTLRATPAPATDKVLAVNINCVVNTVNAALEQIIANQGQVVLISSVLPFLNGIGAIPYAMSKAAVEQLGRGLRVELAPTSPPPPPPTSP
ncbi:SDR family NAD(P)-dependent oxidoreductase [Streptomyces caniscabiei]|uniref:SDR family NAD(P)-dependent oxidoreductase n=1 Tax=Streptomyces caniscabiei TaxID=2746961 RepID=UPI000A797CE1|nr:SDR family NAD(P)-dependent oxidoreductase [Streptomyces caniscabiei]